MSDDVLYRASTELEVVGRTVEGLALPFDSWALVRDLSGPAYPEAHARQSFNETLRRDPGPRPLYSSHEWAFDPTAEPIGVAHFMRSEHALMFRAFLSRTVKADEQRELIRDGAKRSVSVGFQPLRSRNVQRPEGMGRLRVESKLRELSVAPTGFGQYPESKILALRSDASVDDAEEQRDIYEAARRQNLLRLRAGRPLLPLPKAASPVEGTPERLAAAHDVDPTTDNESE